MFHLSLKVTAVKVALSSGSQTQESALSKPLKDQAFATPEKVAELVQKVHIFSPLGFGSRGLGQGDAQCL